MSDETVERALAYFYSHNGASTFIALGFYGGEPLIAFDAIRRATDSLREYERGHETHLHMTTNGTLLTRDKWPFLIEHNFALLVSLDGPVAVHDRYRKNIGGKGTFRTIARNLLQLREYAPDYYKNRISFSCVQAPATSIRSLLRFFSRHPLVRGLRAQVAGVSPGCPELMCRLVSEVSDWEEQRSTSTEAKGEYLGRVAMGRTRGSRFRFLQDLYGKDYILFHRREICAGPGASTWINGMCVPATRRLFVARGGTLFTCERVGRSYHIGHIERGVDFERVFRMLEGHNAFHDEHCRSCWAVRLCGACQSTMGGAEGVDPERVRREYCGNERARLAEVIRTYVQVLEVNPRAWDFIEDISIS